MSQIRIGISGWTFPNWRGTFYPKKLVQKRELEYASRQVNSIEINGTFYALQKPATFQNWYNQTPDDFIFSLKAPQFITHVLRLRECKEPLCTFLASGLLCLKQKLGPILWQFPPYVSLKDNRFEKFVKQLPHNTLKAAKLAKKHDVRFADRVWTETDGNYPVRHAFEFRHPSFQNKDFIEMLKSYQVAVAVIDSGKNWPYTEDLTSDFVYVRMSGEGPEFKNGYTDSALKRMAKRIKLWAKGGQPKDANCISQQEPYPGKKDVFVYFNNDEKINAPQDAARMLKQFKIATK
jgi:uncharacterized protein YecE (DUF72 family)